MSEDTKTTIGSATLPMTEVVQFSSELRALITH